VGVAAVFAGCDPSLDSPVHCRCDDLAEAGIGKPARGFRTGFVGCGSDAAQLAAGAISESAGALIVTGAS
jgi:hypothetical protein